MAVVFLSMLFFFPLILKSKQREMLKLFQFWPSGFPQADASLRIDFDPRPFFCRFPFLNEFTTLADFDLFQLSGKAKENYFYFRRELGSFEEGVDDDSGDHLVIYLLADIKNSKKPLSVVDSPWKIFLMIGDQEIFPKSLELVSEDFALFQTLGSLMDRRKKKYKIVFDLGEASMQALDTKKKKPSLKLKYLNLSRLVDLPVPLN